jgi:hypothetical protein
MKSRESTRMGTPLQRARTHERLVTYVIAGITGIILIMIFRSVTIAVGETAVAQERLMALVVTIVQFAVSATSLVIVRSQVSVATIEIEQAEEADVRLRSLTVAVRSMVDLLAVSQIGESGARAADSPKSASAR